MESLESLKSRLGKARVLLAERKGQQMRLQLDRDTCAAQLADMQDKGLVFEQVVVLLQQTSEHARKQAKEQIEMLVTNTLRSVFGGEYSFRIELTERAGRPEAEFYVVSPFNGDKLETRPQDSRGGGVVDVVSLGLRIAMLETYRPRLEGALILDEPAKHVSEDFIGPTANFLKVISDYFDRQVIMVTHNAHLAETAEVAFSVILKDGQSQVTRTA
jgi:DNA repair exonuclease SbcCD ATPase subunit